MRKEDYNEMQKRTSEYTQVLWKERARCIALKDAANTMVSDGVIDFETQSKISKHYSDNIERIDSYISILENNLTRLQFEFGLLSEEPDAFGEIIVPKPIFGELEKELLKEAEHVAYNLWQCNLLDGYL